MLSKLRKWLNRGMADRNPDTIPGVARARMVLKATWLENTEINKGFSPDFVQAEAVRILKDVTRIAESDDPRMANRIALANLAVQYARLQVLVMDPRPAADPTGFRGQPGITGDMKAHLFRLLKTEPWLQVFLHGVEVAGADDAWDIIMQRYRQTWVWTEVLNAVRMELNDFSPAAEEDWYRPFIAAMAAAYEHDCRKVLGLQPALDNRDNMADRRASDMSAFVNAVREGHPRPEQAWQQRRRDVRQGDAMAA